MNKTGKHTLPKLLSLTIALALGILAVIPVLFFTAETVEAKRIRKPIYDNGDIADWIWVEVPDDEEDAGKPGVPPSYGDINGAKAKDPLAAAVSYNFTFPDSSLIATYKQNGAPVDGCAIGVQAQGGLGGLAFKNAMPAGYREACPFNITINGNTDETLKNGTLSLMIPKEYQKTGRTFKLMGIDKNGNVKIFDNQSAGSLSFVADLDLEGYAFDLIYKD
ncbi:MAG: hypothetical protein J5518_04310 [Lachnospiraceae bacterium]|nr:hypothetical protein [Lachnospiraceae bacterium]